MTKTPGNLRIEDLRYIGQAHLLPGMSEYKQMAIFEKHVYKCDARRKVWPDPETVRLVLAGIRAQVQ